MTATQQFIEDAIKGGYGDTHDRFLLHEVNQEIEFCTYYKEGELDYHGEETNVGQHKCSTRISLGIALLHPLVWQAVYKVRDVEGYSKDSDWKWTTHWHRFIDHLADQKSIEEALQAINITKV